MPNSIIYYNKESKCEKVSFKTQLSYYHEWGVTTNNNNKSSKRESTWQSWLLNEQTPFHNPS